MTELTATRGALKREWPLIVATILVVAGLVVYLSGWGIRLCQQVVDKDHPTSVTVCNRPDASSPLVLGFAVLIGLVLFLRVSELSIPGLISIKRSLDEVQRGTDELRGQLFNLQQTLVTSSTNVTTVVNTDRLLDPSPEDLAGDSVPPRSNSTVDGDHTAHADQLAAFETVRQAKVMVANGAWDSIVADLVGEFAETFSCDYDVFDVRLYAPDDSGRRLCRLTNGSQAPGSAQWLIGQGAVGRAWALNELVAIHGTELVSSLWQVDPERRTRHAELSSVVAVPLVNAYGRQIGILSVASHDVSVNIDDERAFAPMWVAAAQVSRVMIDLLQLDFDTV